MPDQDQKYTPTTEAVRKVYAAAPIVTEANRLSNANVERNWGAFDRWLAAHDAQVLRDAATEIASHYPIDLWPRPTDEEMRKLHKFAVSLGMADGSRFHVGGIRHAISLLAPEADRIAGGTSDA